MINHSVVNSNYDFLLSFFSHYTLYLRVLNGEEQADEDAADHIMREHIKLISSGPANAYVAQYSSELLSEEKGPEETYAAYLISG